MADQGSPLDQFIREDSGPAALSILNGNITEQLNLLFPSQAELLAAAKTLCVLDELENMSIQQNTLSFLRLIQQRYERRHADVLAHPSSRTPQRD